LRRPEQRRRSQWIAQQALQRRAGQAENGADRKCKYRAWQADFPHDYLRNIAALPEQRLDHGERRQRHRADPKRYQKQQHHEQDEAGHHAGTPLRRDVSRRHDARHAHPSSLCSARLLQ
jgi:hypothetical protein